MDSAAELTPRERALVAAIRQVIREELRAMQRPTVPAVDADVDDVDEGLSTAEMADLLGMTEQGFKKWYQRHPDLKELAQRHGRHLRWPAGPVQAWFRYRRDP